MTKICTICGIRPRHRRYCKPCACVVHAMNQYWREKGIPLRSVPRRPRMLLMGANAG